MSKQVNPVNFLPEDYLERKRQQRTNIVCLSLFAVVIAGLVGGFMADEGRQRAVASERETVNRRLTAVGAELVKIQQMQNRKEAMLRKADVTASLLERRPRSYLVARITNDLPSGASLLSVDLTTKVERKKSSSAKAVVKSARSSRAADKTPAKAEPEKPRVEETVRVTGLAPDDKVVSRFIAALNDEALFAKVDLIFSEEHKYNGQDVRRFMVQAELDESVEVTAEMAHSQRLRPGAMDN